MKCPKCNYISFDTPERCRNCGYDFAPPAGTPPAVDGPLRDGRAEDGPLPDLALRQEFDATVAGRPRPGGIDLPLFDEPVPGLDDTPLISAPSAPRPPLAVRRATPDPSRVPRPARPRPGRASAPAVAGPLPPAPAPPPSRPPGAGHRASEPAEEPSLLEAEEAGPPPVAGRRVAGPDATAPRALAPAPGDAAPPLPRLAALAGDLTLLGLINVAVVHFTLSIVRYPWSRIGELPTLPLVAFCAMLDVGYFVLLTGASGQTLGKMLAGIRVVGADGGRVAMTQSALRAALAPLALATLGLGYLPALLGRDPRALHDRLSSTRVVRA